MERNKIIEEIYKDEFYKGYIKSLTPHLADEMYSHFLLKVCEMCETKISLLYDMKSFKYYAVTMIRNEVYNKRSPFNKLYNEGHANIDDFYSLAYEDDETTDEDLVNELVEDMYSFLKGRTQRVKGAWYDEKLFKAFFENDETYRSLADKTDIHYCSIFNSIKGTKEVMNTKFKERYDNL